MFDALPVSSDAQLLAALLHRLCRTSAVGLAALALRWLAGGELSDARATASLVLFVFVVASGEVLAALEWVHWARVRVRAQGVAMLVLLAVCASVTRPRPDKPRHRPDASSEPGRRDERASIARPSQRC